MDVQIVSIPHTGTHFTRDLLLEHGVNITEFDHLSAIDGVGFPYKTFENIIAPVRPPKDVAFSWGRDGRRVNYGWEVLWTKLSEINGHFFFLEDKDVALLKLSKHLGVPLTSDWKRVNFSNADSPPFITDEQIVMAEQIYNSLRGLHG